MTKHPVFCRTSGSRVLLRFSGENFFGEDGLKNDEIKFSSSSPPKTLLSHVLSCPSYPSYPSVVLSPDPGLISCPRSLFPEHTALLCLHSRVLTPTSLPQPTLVFSHHTPPHVVLRICPSASSCKCIWAWFRAFYSSLSSFMMIFPFFL